MSAESKVYQKLLDASNKRISTAIIKSMSTNIYFKSEDGRFFVVASDGKILLRTKYEAKARNLCALP